ncbi:hypothetical protein Trydic_g13028 [Trypoxylus dichotomus]
MWTGQKPQALRIEYLKTFEALFVLAWTPPIDLLVEKMSKTEQGSDSSRENIHNIMLDRWQNRWSSDTGRAAWTKTLIRDIRPWVHRKHGQVSYFLTQFLTGHGSYQAFNYCNRIDTAEYTFFESPTWAAPETQRPERIIGHVTNYHRSKYSRKLRKFEGSGSYGAKDNGKEIEQ